MDGKYFIIYYDNSHSILGVVLIQDKKVKDYVSHQLKVHERNHSTHDLELATLVIALKIWQNYLYGVKCEVSTNHHSLDHMFSQKDLNSK